VVTTVLKLLELDEMSENDGSGESGVCRIDLVVGEIVSRSDGNGPITVGYTPVQ
jgi:hypothetical protein